MILGRTAQHRRPTNIDLLDRLGKANPRPGNGLFKRIKVDHHQIDHANSMLLGGSQVLGVVAQAKQAPMNFWVESLYPTIHHFGKAGMVANIGNWHPFLP